MLLLIGFYAATYPLLGTIIGLAALFLFLYPIIRAYQIAQHLPADIKKAFRQNNSPTTAKVTQPDYFPFSIYKLLQTVTQLSFRTLKYATYDDITLTLDFYSSPLTGKQPCLIVIHGGSWNSGNSKQLPELNSYLAKIGYHVAAINYRLSPQWQCPAPIDDVAAALTYLCDHADQLNIDSDNFALLGRSAGGQIALLAAYTLRQSCIKGVIDMYGPADMIWGYMVPTNPLVMDSRRTLASYVGGHYPEIPQKYVASSPIEFVNQQSVPTLIFHGNTDSLVFDEHSHRLATKLAKNNVPHYFLELPWATHGFDYHLYGPGGQLSTYAIEQFLPIVFGNYLKK